MDSVIDGSMRLCKGAAALDMPVIVTGVQPSRSLRRTCSSIVFDVHGCQFQSSFQEEQISKCDCTAEQFPKALGHTHSVRKRLQALRLYVPAEQYPKALGHTVGELAAMLPKDSLVVEKTRFSMAGEPLYMDNHEHAAPSRENGPEL